MNFHLFINEIYYLIWILLITFILSLIFIANVEKFKKYELFIYSLIFLGFLSGNLLLIFHTIFFINSGIILNLNFIFFLLFVGSILWVNYVTYKIILKKIILGLIYLPLVVVFVILQVTFKSENIYKISKYCKPIQDKKIQCIYDEDKYVGDLKSFQRHGEGTYFWKSGGTYTGKWVEDKREGYGIEKFPSGARYTGEFKNSSFNGSGVYIYPDGGKYEGQWKNGKKEGRGISILADGNRIEGEFKDGKLLTKEKNKKLILKMIKSYFGINFDAIVVAGLFSLIFFFIIYKFKIVDFLVEKIIYPLIIFFINIYNLINDAFKGEKNTSKVEKQDEDGERISDKIKAYINKQLSVVSDWFSIGIIWKFIFIIYIPFLFINYLLISKTTNQTILPLNLNNIFDSFGATLGAILVSLVLSFILVPAMEIKFKKSFPLACLFFFLIGIIHYFFVES